MSIKLQLPKLTDLKPRITVLGVGGAGCNAINNMIAAGLEGVAFVVANTDAQALAASSAEHRLQLGINLTEGLGAGSRPEIGEAAAEEAIDDIRSHIAGSHMVFIAAGMGGGTGTGAAGVIARAAKELGILTVGIVTRPFHFEGARRMRIAEVGIAEVRKHVDTLIVIPNQNLFRIANEKTTFAEAFVLADQVLYSGVACIVDLIIKEGLINLDFADVRTVMSGMGSAVMGTGEASGDQRATIAAEEAIANPLLDDVSLRGARGLLLSITGGRNLTLYEVDEAASRVRQEVDPEANIIVGATFDETLGDRVRVSIVASGMARIEGAPAQATRSPAEMRADMRGRVPQAPAPERAPQPYARSTEEDDIKRRLSEAMGHPHEAAPRQTPPAVPPSNGAAPRETHRETWRARGNVVIEEGFSQMAWPQPAARAQDQEGDATGARADQFTPAPPTDIRRGARRMPDVDDFPPVAQREYRAKAGHAHAMPPAPSRAASGRDVPEEAPRPGLLQRIMSRARRTYEPEAPSHHDDQRRMPGPSADGQSWWQQDNDSDPDGPDDEQSALPMVFNRHRK
jgi:cell division protein FtsZ